MSPARPRIVAALLALGLSACQAPPPPTPATPVTPASTRPAVASPKPAGSPPGVAPPAAPASAAPASAALSRPTLRVPAGERTMLSGRVIIDAAYMTQVGAGLVGLDGASVIAGDGAGLIGDGGGTLIGDGGGTLIAPDASSVVSNDGAGLIAADGTSLIAAGIVAGGGGNAVARYRLAATAPLAGTRLPAAGMRVRAIDLRDGKPIALGEDDARQPVYAILSGPDGSFKVSLPKDLPRNFRCVAEVPGNPDPRLALSVLAGAGRGTIDEPGELAYKYVRSSYIGRLADVLDGVTDPAEAALRLTGEQTLVPFALPAVIPFMAHVAQYHARHPGLTATERYALAARIASTVLAETDLSDPALYVDPTRARYEGKETDQALGALTAVVGDSLVRVGEVMRGQANPEDFFRASLIRPDLRGALDPTTVTIRKPADFQDYLVRAYFAPSAFKEDRRVDLVNGLSTALDVHTNKDKPGRLYAAIRAISLRIFHTALSPETDPATGLTVGQKVGALLDKS